MELDALDRRDERSEDAREEEREAGKHVEEDHEEAQEALRLRPDLMREACATNATKQNTTTEDPWRA